MDQEVKLANNTRNSLLIFADSKPHKRHLLTKNM